MNEGRGERGERGVLAEKMRKNSHLRLPKISQFLAEEARVACWRSPFEIPLCLLTEKKDRQKKKTTYTMNVSQIEVETH